MVVDSGGPYSYGSYERESYFSSSKAHNVIVVDGQDLSGGAKYIASGVDEYSSWVTASSSLGEVEHTRSVVVIDEGVVVIRDLIVADEMHTYELLFHMPPSAEVSAGEVTVADFEGSSLYVKSSSSRPLIPEVIEGVRQPELQGWVTPDTLTMVESPVLSYTFNGRGQEIFTFLVPSSSDRDYDLQVEMSGSSVNVDAGEKWRIFFGDDENYEIFVDRVP